MLKKMDVTISKNHENSEDARWGYFRGNTAQLLVGFNLTFGVVISLVRTCSDCALLICMTNVG